MEFASTLFRTKACSNLHERFVPTVTVHSNLWWAWQKAACISFASLRKNVKLNLFILFIYLSLVNISACFDCFQFEFLVAYPWILIVLLRMDKLNLVCVMTEIHKAALENRATQYVKYDHSSFLFIFSDSFLSSSTVSLIQSPQGKCWRFSNASCPLSYI